MNLQNFYFSGLQFSKDEDLLKFKFKMLNIILLIITFFSTLFGALSDLGINDIGPIHSKVNYVYASICFALIFFLRRSKINYFRASSILLITSFFVFISALVNVPQDEFRIIWFYLLIIVAYILSGKTSGVFVTGVSIFGILIINTIIDLQLSSIAINSAVLGMIIGSSLSYTYSNKIISYELSLYEKTKALEILASTDGLTGIMNKRIFNEVSERYFSTAERYEKSLALLLLDLDHFKKINDDYGHQLGDFYLTRFVDTIQGLLRKSDTFARIGGEEFAILLFKTDEENALLTAEKLRKEIEHMSIICRGDIIKVSTSIGISVYKEDDKSFDDIFSRADRALYHAKEHGRNQSYVSAE